MEHFFDDLRMNFVVGIEEHDVLAGGFFETGVAGAGGGAGIFLIDEDDSWVLFFGVFEQFWSVVGGAVID